MFYSAAKSPGGRTRCKKLPFFWFHHIIHRFLDIRWYKVFSHQICYKKVYACITVKMYGGRGEVVFLQIMTEENLTLELTSKLYFITQQITAKAIYFLMIRNSNIMRLLAVNSFHLLGENLEMHQIKCQTQFSR